MEEAAVNSLWKLHAKQVNEHETFNKYWIRGDMYNSTLNSI